MTEAEKCLLDLRNRLALIHDLCCGTAPKQSVGELVYVMLDMPEWDVVRAALAAPAQAEPVNAEALHAECKRVAHNAIHDAIYKIDDCEPVKDAVRDALDSIDLSEFAAK